MGGGGWKLPILGRHSLWTPLSKYDITSQNKEQATAVYVVGFKILIFAYLFQVCLKTFMRAYLQRKKGWLHAHESKKGLVHTI